MTDSIAESLKARGNEYFAKGKIDAAIDAYSEVRHPNQPRQTAALRPAARLPAVVGAALVRPRCCPLPHQAICLEPTHAVYYTNRALCHFKKENWAQACSLDDFRAVVALTARVVLFE